jgi:hypothetical protein
MKMTKNVPRLLVALKMVVCGMINRNHGIKCFYTNILLLYLDIYNEFVDKVLILFCRLSVEIKLIYIAFNRFIEKFNKPFMDYFFRSNMLF